MQTPFPFSHFSWPACNCVTPRVLVPKQKRPFAPGNQQGDQLGTLNPSDGEESVRKYSVDGTEYIKKDTTTTTIIPAHFRPIVRQGLSALILLHHPDRTIATTYHLVPCVSHQPIVTDCAHQTLGHPREGQGPVKQSLCSYGVPPQRSYMNDPCFTSSFLFVAFRRKHGLASKIELGTLSLCVKKIVLRITFVPACLHKPKLGTYRHYFPRCLNTPGTLVVSRAGHTDNRFY